MPPRGATEPPHIECPPLATGAYGKWFTDLGVWAPTVEWVARRHGLGAPGTVSVGVPGSHPVFLTAAGYVVKFYAPHWPEAHAAEVAVYDVLAGAGGGLAGTAVPRVLARGAVFPGSERWPWPYLVCTRVPGRSAGELGAALTPQDRLAMASALGPAVRALHALAPGAAHAMAEHARARLEALGHTAVERLRGEGTWPEGLLAGVPAYLNAARTASAAIDPRLVHADLSRDHILLARRGPGWAFSGLIDFADAQVVDPAYELVALHVDLFGCDRRLLVAFLQGYGGERALGPDWRRRATAFVLLFPNSLGSALWTGLVNWPLLRTPRDLEEVLWPGRL